MRIIFLDFDGVLHPLGLQVEEHRTLNGKPVAKAIKVDFFCWLPLLLELVAEHGDVRFVAHTAWRESHDLARLQGYFGEHRHLLVGATRADLPKLESIQVWLEQNPQVAHWRILDDAVEEFVVVAGDADTQEPAQYAPGLIACDYRRGLQDLEVRRQLAHWLHLTRPQA
jgi:hypothetical protein